MTWRCAVNIIGIILPAGVKIIVTKYVKCNKMLIQEETWMTPIYR